MDNDAIKKHRIARLEAAIKERFDESAADLAAALGLKNAAFLRQMISGHRPITEKTIAKIEALKGMAGWFGLQVMTADGTPMVLTFDEVDAVMGIRAAKAAREAAPSNVSQFPPPPPPAPSGGMRSVSRLGAQAAKKTSKRKGGA